MRSKSAFHYAICLTVACAAFTPGAVWGKTVRACEDEWKANKAAIQGAGKKKTDFMTECRAQTVSATPAPAPATEPQPNAGASANASPAAPTPAQPSSTPQNERSRTASTVPPRPAAVAPTQANQFRTEAEAKAHCPGDNVVWANTHSHIYHYAGTRGFGNTKAGAYMCERDTAQARIRAAKNEKRPE